MFSWIINKRYKKTGTAKAAPAVLFAELALFAGTEPFLSGTVPALVVLLEVWNHLAGKLPDQVCRVVFPMRLFLLVEPFVDIVFPRHFDSSCLINFAWALENITQKK